MESIFKDTIAANKNWGIDQLSEAEKIEVVREQFKRARLEIDECEAEFERWVHGEAMDAEVVEEMADVAIFMQSACFAMTGAPLDEMIKKKSAKVLERKGVMLGGSFVKEKDLKAVFGIDSHDFIIDGDRLLYWQGKLEVDIPKDTAASYVRDWMASREL